MHRATTFAPAPAFGKLLPNFCTTVRTYLRRSCGIYFYDHGTSPFSLVPEDPPEVVPANIGYRPGQPVVPQHPSDIEALHSEPTIAVHQSISNFIVILAPQLANASMQLGNLGYGLAPIFAAFLLARYRTLSSSQLRQLLLKKTRIRFVLTLVRRKETFQTDIEARRRILLRGNLHFSPRSQESTTYHLPASRLSVAVLTTPSWVRCTLARIRPTYLLHT